MKLKFTNHHCKEMKGIERMPFPKQSHHSGDRFTAFAMTLVDYRHCDEWPGFERSTKKQSIQLGDCLPGRQTGFAMLHFPCNDEQLFKSIKLAI